jgi:hypothetical protein
MASSKVRLDSKPKPLHMNGSSGANAPELEQKELSAPRPRGGRLVIFDLCAVRTDEKPLIHWKSLY